MSNAVILGVGLHPFGRFPDKSLAELAREAILNACDDAGVKPKDIQASFCGHVFGGVGAGLLTTNEAGITGVPITNVEQACASSAVALKFACLSVQSGQYDTVLATGFEKLPRGLVLPPQHELTHYWRYQSLMGLTAQPLVAAWAMRRYMADYGATREQIAQVAVIAHRNAVHSPEAQFQKVLTLEEVLSSRMICDPLTLYQCCPTTHGASAAVVCSEKKARQFTTKPIILAGWGLESNMPAGERPGFYPEEESTAVPRSAKRAYEMAGVGPSDIDVAQIHNPFTIIEVMGIEALGFCEEGGGARLVWEGESEIGGKIPVNTDGGTQAFGHPLGATGLRQTTELVRQLRGQAGERQVANAKVALAYNQGQGGSSVQIFSR